MGEGMRLRGAAAHEKESDHYKSHRLSVMMRRLCIIFGEGARRRAVVAQK